MRVLAIDSSTDILSVAVRGEGGAAEASIDSGLTHAERLMELVDFCTRRSGLEPSAIELVACARGPGSFTGLRIGMATAKGIALGLGIPWVAVPTLDCLAWGREDFPGVVVPVVDGKKGRLYSAVYAGGLRRGAWLDLPLAALAALLDTFPEALVTGPAAELFGDYARGRSGLRLDRLARSPAARALATLGEAAFLRDGGTAPGEGPLYLRPSEAEETAAIKAAIEREAAVQ